MIPEPQEPTYSDMRQKLRERAEALAKQKQSQAGKTQEPGQQLASPEPAAEEKVDTPVQPEKPMTDDTEATADG